ncbi:hypothetical protein P3L10_000174 [Capsicum annuum]
MANWTELPNDLIAHIAKRVKVNEDFIAFRRALASTSTAYVGLSKWGACFSSKGWLICFLHLLNPLEISLFNPFSRKKIQLPPGKNLWPLQGCEAGPEGTMPFINNAVLSTDPSVTSDYALMVSYYVLGHNGLSGYNCLSFWRHRDLHHWTKIYSGNWGKVTSMNYYKGKFYFVTSWEDHLHPSLVELSDALLLVTRYFHHGGRCRCQNFKFKVRELDVIKGELKEINTLGDSAIFLSLNGASSIDSSKFTQVKNCYKKCEECGVERYIQDPTILKMEKLNLFVLNWH